MKDLEPVFGSQKARDVDEETITPYSTERLLAGAMPATVQREVSCLRRMFRLGLEHKLISTLPSFPQIEHDGLNAPQGFFENVDFQKVCAALPAHLQVLTVVANLTGARKGEFLKLEWRHVDLESGKVQLEGGMVKNKNARFFFLPAEALQALIRWKRSTKEWELQHQCTVPTVFHLDGKPIKDFRAAWDRAFTVAGVLRNSFTICGEARSEITSARVLRRVPLKISPVIARKGFLTATTSETMRTSWRPSRPSPAGYTKCEMGKEWGRSGSGRASKPAH